MTDFGGYDRTQRCVSQCPLTCFVGVAESRLPGVLDYLAKLVQLPVEISRCSHVTGFFELEGSEHRQSPTPTHPGYEIPMHDMASSSQPRDQDGAAARTASYLEVRVRTGGWAASSGPVTRRLHAPALSLFRVFLADKAQHVRAFIDNQGHVATHVRLDEWRCRLGCLLIRPCLRSGIRCGCSRGCSDRCRKRRLQGCRIDGAAIAGSAAVPGAAASAVSRRPAQAMQCRRRSSGRLALDRATAGVRGVTTVQRWPTHRCRGHCSCWPSASSSSSSLIIFSPPPPPPSSSRRYMMCNPDGSVVPMMVPYSMAPMTHQPPMAPQTASGWVPVQAPMATAVYDNGVPYAMAGLQQPYYDPMA